MKFLVCHPGTQHATKLAAALKKQDLLARFFTGLRLKPDSMLGRYLRLSGLRELDESLAECTKQIWAPEVFGKAAQSIGWNGEGMMRLRNAWFQRLVPDRAIASSDGVIGFDTASWLLARRARKLGTPFLLDRTTIHRAARPAIRAASGNKPTGSMSSEVGVQDVLEAEEMTLASKIVVASRFAESSLVEAGIPAKKIVVIPYGVNSDWFVDAPSRQKAVKKLIFLYVGHFTKEKGLEVLLAAWQMLGSVEAELWLAGTGDPEMIHKVGSVTGVRLLGKLGPRELQEAYRSATVFVFPTLLDGFGMVLLEAMASGLPVIASPHCAAPELLEEGRAGSICPAGNSVALAATMADACSNRLSWINRGIQAREIARSYSWESYGSRWAALLKEVIQ